MSAQWNGALTWSGNARLAPAANAEAVTRATAPACPATTICPGPLKFAQDTISPCAASSQIRSSGARSRPRIAAIAPTPAGTASCMNRPRARTVRTASARLKVEAATCAAYSPSEWPAAAWGDGPPRARKARYAAIATTRIAGCVVSVRASSSSVPAKQVALSARPRASSASAKTAAAAGSFARSLPMPEYCAPWPGKIAANGFTSAPRSPPT
jgi:hypothetical protein